MIINVLFGLLIIIGAFAITKPLVDLIVQQSEIDRIDEIGEWAKKQLKQRGQDPKGGIRMTLEEAIIHAEEVAEFSDRECMRERFYGEKEMKRKCAEEHRQLVGWLKLLKRILESGDCNECAIQKTCNVRPEWGEQVRYNCHMFARKKED